MGRLESTNNFEGFSNRILKGKITDFECKSLEKGKDVYWIISITFENSKFADKIYTVGMFERDVDGKVKANWLIDKVNKFLDFINYTGGFNIDGEFETMEGKVIQQDEIQNEIFKHMMDNMVCVFDNLDVEMVASLCHCNYLYLFLHCTK